MATKNNRRRQRRTRQRARRPIRVVAVKRKEIDPDMIAMAYWMMAKRAGNGEHHDSRK